VYCCADISDWSIYIGNAHWNQQNPSWGTSGGILSQINPVHPLNRMLSRSNFMFSSYLHLELLSYFFPLGFRTKILYEFRIPPHAGTHWNGPCLPLLPVSAVLWDGQQSNRSVEEALDPSERLWLKIRIRPHQMMLSLQLPKPAITDLIQKSPCTCNIILCILRNIRGQAEKFFLHLNRKWTGKDILMEKKRNMPTSIIFKAA